MPVRARVAVVLCFAALGCGGGGGVAGPPAVATVSVTLAQPSVAIGATTGATATPKDAGGNALTGRAISWSSDNTGVATVSSAGVVTAVSTGTASIIATSEGRSGSAPLTVVGTAVASVSVSLASSTIGVGKSTQGTATTKDANGAVVTGRSIVWSSDNTAVATVTVATGVVTGVAAGTANIKATSEGQSGSTGVTVEPQMGFGSSAEKIRIVDVGGTFTPTLTGASAGAATFVSRATSVATINAQGTITAVGEGQVWVAASAPGYTADSVYVIVPRSSTGPILRTDLGTFNVKRGDSTFNFNVILDTRSTPIGGTELTVGFTTNPTIFTAGSYAVTTGPPAPVVTNLQAGLLRVSLASVNPPVTGAHPILQLKFTTSSVEASGFITLTFIDLVGPAGEDLIPVATSTRIPIIVHD